VDDAAAGCDPVVCRMNVFPPKQQSLLLKSLDTLIEEMDEADRPFSIDYKGFTHMISVVQVYQYSGKGLERQAAKDNAETNNRYMVGIAPASKKDVVDTNNIIANDSSGQEVNRAYYKLKEATGTYKASDGVLNEDLYGSIALDCGSAPGGWTKYLIEHFGCKQVFSVDPGKLAPSVLNMKETVHMPMKLQDALPKLLDEGMCGNVKIWVSDMCLHHMSEQVDLLLHANEMGILSPNNAFFVLTLKCTVGHSKASYDGQVEKVVDKLYAGANVHGVKTFHLFSNRSGERTVIGYINK